MKYYGILALYSEWHQTFLDNLRKCGDTDPVPTTAAERWARARKFRHTPIQLTNTSRGQVEKFRCPRCLAGNFRGLTKFTGRAAEFALPTGSVIHYPDPERANSDQEPSHALMIHGEAAPIWVRKDKETTQSSPFTRKPPDELSHETGHAESH